MLKALISRRFMPLRIIVLVVVGCLALLGARYRHIDAQHPVTSATPAPELVGDTWLNSNGPVHLSDRKGKVTMVEFWTFACSNCRANLPVYERIQKRFGGDNFSIVSIHTPELKQEFDTNNVKKFVSDSAIAYPVLIDNKYANWDRWKQEFWPAVYLVDKQGNIRQKWVGELNYLGHDGEGEVCAEITRLLAE